MRGGKARRVMTMAMIVAAVPYGKRGGRDEAMEERLTGGGARPSEGVVPLTDRADARGHQRAANPCGRATWANTCSGNSCGYSLSDPEMRHTRPNTSRASRGWVGS